MGRLSVLKRAIEQATRDPSPGSRIAGKFILTRPIGNGGMGTVWIARSEATGADVALKLLRRDSDTGADTSERFKREAQLGAMLSHRSIVQTFDLVETEDGVLVLVLELLRGQTP